MSQVRWPIRPEVRGPIMDAMARMALDSELHPKIRQGAVERILRAEAQNQKDEHHADGSDVRSQVTNQQINIYVPDNGRGPALPSVLPQISSNGNGHH